MKLTRILPLVVLVGGATFMLCSCDQLLDGIYNPSNQINVEIAVNTTTHPDFNWGYMKVQLSGPVSFWQKATYSSSDSQYAYYYFTFTKLPDGSYNIIATYFVRSSPIGNGYANNITMPVINSSNPGSPSRSVSIPPININ